MAWRVGIDIAGTFTDVAAGDLASLAHGTTAGTNALIEGTGARAGLIATAGFLPRTESLGSLHLTKPAGLPARAAAAAGEGKDKPGEPTKK